MGFPAIVKTKVTSVLFKAYYASSASRMSTGLCELRVWVKHFPEIDDLEVAA
jgi:hypothetical protein